VSAWVLARYDPDEAWRFLQQALDSDIADVQGGTTSEGIHLGAMAGTVDMVLRCLTGMRARGQVLRFDPALPPQVKELRFSVHYRGHRVELACAEDRVEVSSRPGPAAPITVLVGQESVELSCGVSHTFSLEHRS
jgi:trehalose/maltose hydrolase-like predicted phosphorylase